MLTCSFSVICVNRVIEASASHETFRQFFFPGFRERIHHVLRPFCQWTERYWCPEPEVLPQWPPRASHQAGTSPECTHWLPSAAMWGRVPLPLNPGDPAGHHMAIQFAWIKRICLNRFTITPEYPECVPSRIREDIKKILPLGVVLPRASLDLNSLLLSPYLL